MPDADPLVVARSSRRREWSFPSPSVVDEYESNSIPTR
jgi:hypothetical protein